MANLNELISQLKSSGITPKVQICISPETADIPAVVKLHAELMSSGLTPEVFVTVQPGTGGQGSTLSPGADEQSFEVIVTDLKALCMTFSSKDGAGKPIMEIREPRIKLLKGTRFMVSATHKVSDRDSGDGTITGTGGVTYYFITKCPTALEAAGFYVRQSEVERV